VKPRCGCNITWGGGETTSFEWACARAAVVFGWLGSGATELVAFDSTGPASVDQGGDASILADTNCGL
jgi:hypothetical protein